MEGGNRPVFSVICNICFLTWGAALGGEASGSEALVGGLRWGLYACVGFAVLALPVVLMGLPRSVASKDRG
jgi:hypothetical protein